MKTCFIAIASIFFFFFFGGCYLSTELCEPVEGIASVQYLGRTCPEPIHDLIPRESFREVRDLWEGRALIGCELAGPPEVIGRTSGFRLEFREAFPERPCYEGEGRGIDHNCARVFDRYFELFFVDEETGRDFCSERWGITYDYRIE